MVLWYTVRMCCPVYRPGELYVVFLEVYHSRESTRGPLAVHSQSTRSLPSHSIRHRPSSQLPEYRILMFLDTGEMLHVWIGQMGESRRRVLGAQPTCTLHRNLTADQQLRELFSHTKLAGDRLPQVLILPPSL
jgi:hypothetical protein